MTALRAAFLSQANSCEALGSPFMGRLLRLLAEHWPTNTDLAQKCNGFTGDIGPNGHSLPLRIASGLHALVLRNSDAALATVYPPHTADETTFRDEILAALHRHDTKLCSWIDNAPQTNEVRRSAALIATAHLLVNRFNLPLKLSELGASAGLNLMFDRFQLAVGNGYGPPSTVTLSPDWSGALPPKAQVRVTERCGVDLNPLDSHTPENALRLQAYLWADQADRLERTRAAIALQDAPVDKSDAVDWLAPRLNTPESGTLHLVYSTVAWQYFPEDKKTEGTALMERAGDKATPDAPLAWLSYEADDTPDGAALSLRLWPGNHSIALGRADFHGRWIKWTAPATLT